MNTDPAQTHPLSPLCVYCAAGWGARPAYAHAARTMGDAMARRGIDLVYGGGKLGLMREVADAVLNGGGHVLGVITHDLKHKEVAHDAVSRMVVVETMHERKKRMADEARGFVALPGGWGTLEEIMEIITLRQLDVIRKPCVFLNQDGFYDDLLRLFSRMLADRFFKPSNMELFSVATTALDVFASIEAGVVTKVEPKWFETR